MTQSETAVPEPIEALRLLGNRRRLLLIRYLWLCGPGRDIAVRHVARVVRAIETDACPATVTTEEYESAYNSLIQNHLPQLAAAGLIDYDDRGKMISPNKRLTRYALISGVAQQLLA